MRGLSELGADDRFGFVVELDQQQAASDGKVWIHCAEAGNWYNERHGDIPITQSDLSKMLENFRSVHPIAPVQIPIDYEHLSMKADRKPGDGEAAGWIHDLQLRDGGKSLWALVEWVKDAAEKIRDRKYRFFSPTFHPNWTPLKGGQKTGPTLLGGALTNYPTLPLQALTCSLIAADALAIRTAGTRTGASDMKTIKVKNSAGQEIEIEISSLGALTLDALSEAVPAVKDLQAKVAAVKDGPINLDQFNALDASVKTLSAEVNALAAKNAELATSNTELKKQADEARKNAIVLELDTLCAQGRVLPNEKDMLIELSTANRPLFDKMIDARKKADPIIKTEHQHGDGGGNIDGNSPVVKLDAIVEDIKAKNPKMSHADAVVKAGKEHPELVDARNKHLVTRGGAVIFAQR